MTLHTATIKGNKKLWSIDTRISPSEAARMRKDGIDISELVYVEEVDARTGQRIHGTIKEAMG